MKTQNEEATDIRVLFPSPGWCWPVILTPHEAEAGGSELQSEFKDKLRSLVRCGLKRDRGGRQLSSRELA